MLTFNTIELTMTLGINGMYQPSFVGIFMLNYCFPNQKLAGKKRVELECNCVFAPYKKFKDNVKVRATTNRGMTAFTSTDQCIKKDLTSQY